jgi:hypothetical protein
VNVADSPRKVAKSGLKMVCEAASGRVVGAVRERSTRDPRVVCREFVRSVQQRVAPTRVCSGRTSEPARMAGANQ